jgi:hypothetical protein
VFNNAVSNIFNRNTTDTYNLLKYKMQHVSVPTEPLSGQFNSLELRTLSVCVCVCVCVCVQIMESQTVYNIMTAKYENG